MVEAPRSGLPPKKRKTRPSRGRGLRTNTGCLTCRKRRLKCDEQRPVCGQCTKSSRPCAYSDDHKSDVSSANSQFSSTSPTQTSKRLSQGDFTRDAFSATQATDAPPLMERNRTFSTESRSYSNPVDVPGPTHHASTDLALSPLTQTSSHTPGTGSLDWYDLIAQDAARNIDNYNFLTSSGSRWSFEPGDTSRPSRQQRTQPVYGNLPLYIHHPYDESELPRLAKHTISLLRTANEPWNTARPVSLEDGDLQYFKYFIDVLGPMMDLFDSSRHFTNFVPHLALHNTGVLKSILAVAARHKGIVSAKEAVIPERMASSPQTPNSRHMRDEDKATQYYYDTLHYLSSAMKYPSYARSLEIIATAVLISTYEAFGSDASEDWERHLKGVFWIQRSQDNNGERDGLRKAVWWNWLRQDAWAALRSKRKTLTIWRPSKTLNELTPEELASRALFLLAKAVGYASEEAMQAQDLTQRIEEGNMLLCSLEDWHNHLPLEFKPMPTSQAFAARKPFPEIWIHPPMFAAAMQAYASARILILLYKPSIGGPSAWQDAQKMLDQSVSTICGIAHSPRSMEMAFSMVNFQALYIAGLCVRDEKQQDFILSHLQQALDLCMFPAKNLIHELRDTWSRNG